MIYLIENGADVNAKDEDGSTALHESTRGFNSNADVTKYLIEKGADVNAKDNHGSVNRKMGRPRKDPNAPLPSMVPYLPPRIEIIDEDGD